MRQVITIELGGVVSGLQRKPGQGLDLTKLGIAQVERVSEILWDEDQQAWYVQPIKGPFEGKWLTHGMWATEVEVFRPKGVKEGTGGEHKDHVMYFDNYDDAVAAEVAFLDAARLKGVF